MQTPGREGASGMWKINTNKTNLSHKTEAESKRRLARIPEFHSGKTKTEEIPLTGTRARKIGF